MSIFRRLIAKLLALNNQSTHKRQLLILPQTIRWTHYWFYRHKRVYDLNKKPVQKIYLKMRKVVQHTSNLYYKFKKEFQNSAFYCQIMLWLYLAKIEKKFISFYNNHINNSLSEESHLCYCIVVWLYTSTWCIAQCPLVSLTQKCRIWTFICSFLLFYILLKIKYKI